MRFLHTPTTAFDHNPAPGWVSPRRRRPAPHNETSALPAGSDAAAGRAKRPSGIGEMVNNRSAARVMLVTAGAVPAAAPPAVLAAQPRLAGGPGRPAPCTGGHGKPTLSPC